MDDPIDDVLNLQRIERRQRLAAGAAGAGDTFQGRGVVFDLPGDL